MATTRKWIALLAVIFVGCVGCNRTVLQSPVDAASFVGSLDTEGFSLDLPVYDNLQEMTEEADLIVKGSVSNSPESYDAGDNITNSLYTVTVNSVLKGTESKTVAVMQMGEPTSDDYETKLRLGKNYLLFLTKAFTRSTEQGDQTVYAAIGVEQGVFEIAKTGALKAYSRIGMSTKIDGKNETDFSKTVAVQVEKEHKSVAAQ